MAKALDEKLEKMSTEQQKLWALRHTAEHVLHTAMQNLYPNLKKTMGPAIETGFYHDCEVDTKISNEDFPKIEKEMQKLIDADSLMVQEFITPAEAKKIFKDNPYKLEWLENIEKRGEKVSIYKMGDDDLDLCSGPHIKSTGEIKAFKLLSVAGAYWRGNEKNKMLTRIYGTAFPTQKELDKYLWQQEEAKKRDHRKLGIQLDLWTFSDLVGAGLPLFTQKGALVRRLINEYIESLQSKQEIYQVWTPQITKAELFKISGHYYKYKENLFSVKSNYSEEEFFLKPMNCPQHTQIYKSQPRSYKELPVRLADFAMLYRDEKPGELLGLVRTRSFSQDDCHIFCREDQIEVEMNNALEMTKQIMKTYGFAYKYRLSVRNPEHPEKYIGEPAIWEKVEKLSEKILKEQGIEYYIGVGEAAFYAPKLDLIATDSLGREWQLSTLQIDFFMPERFGLTYIDQEGKEQRPVMLHRAIAGSTERLMGILLEHYAGAFPLWLSPVQIAILPVSDKFAAYAENIGRKLTEAGIRAEVDNSAETLSKKIRNWETQKTPYIAIVGQREESNNQISIRKRGEGDKGLLDADSFAVKLQTEIKEKK